ncbi:MAG: hypothetical protein DHS20C02_19410 [Micavibrio sp.]|nr:MAG: hypothetical protein DHS20C02_19410 [Micavibrio sp.]
MQDVYQLRKVRTSLPTKCQSLQNLYILPISAFKTFDKLGYISYNVGMKNGSSKPQKHPTLFPRRGNSSVLDYVKLIRRITTNELKKNSSNPLKQKKAGGAPSLKFTNKLKDIN